MAKPNTPGDQAPRLSAVEQEATEMLRANDEGEIDNVWDIVDELMSIQERLPASSPLRPLWNTFYDECEAIMRGDD